MKDKKQSRLRRAKRIRAKIRRDGVVRLSVHRTSQHIYAQVIDATGGNVITSSSTLDPVIKKEVKHGGNIAAAQAVGKRIAELAKEQGVDSLVFDRSGFRYHGRVKALADAAREAGLNF
ncbi:MAG: 50S ribosomal protein L18 [Arenicella sp.]